MAGHKGYVIAALIDVMAGVLTGSSFLSAVNGPYKYDRRSGAGHFLIALDIARVQPLAEYEARIERFIAELKAVPLAQGADEVFYPGELEARNDETNRAQGLDLPVQTVTDLSRITVEMGLRADL